MEETNLPNTFFKAGTQFLILNSYLNLNENIALEVAKKRKKLEHSKRKKKKKRESIYELCLFKLRNCVRNLETDVFCISKKLCLQQ